MRAVPLLARVRRRRWPVAVGRIIRSFLPSRPAASILLERIASARTDEQTKHNYKSTSD